MTLFRPSVHQAVVPPPPVVHGLGGDDILAASQALALVSPLHVAGMVRPYLAHQGAAHVAINDAIERFGCGLLADDMGMGKTQVLFGLASERIANGGYVIMVAPPVARVGYMGDLAAAFPHLRFHHIKGRTKAALPVADIYFLNDDSLTMQAWLTNVETYTDRHDREQTRLVANDFTLGAKMFVRDEIHRDKGNNGSPKTGRAKVMIAVGAGLREARIPIVGATGTLLTNRVIESFVPLTYLGGDHLVLTLTPGATKVASFKTRYCNPVEVRTATGYVTVYSSDLDKAEKLHELLRRTVYVRREKVDLGDILPHGGWSVVPLGLNGSALVRYDRIVKQFLALIEEEKGIEAMWKASASRALALKQMTAMYQEAGVAKAQAAVEYVKDLVNQGRQVVTFHVHNDVRDALLNAMAKANISTVRIDGSVTDDARTAAVQTFQAGDAQVAVCNIKAAGMAVTLTAAADAVFVQCPWSAGDLKQAADRILRCDVISYARAAQGQSITWHILQSCYADGTPTFDASIFRVLENKAKVCDAVNAGRPVTMSDDSITEEILRDWYPAARR